MESSVRRIRKRLFALVWRRSDRKWRDGQFSASFQKRQVLRLYGACGNPAEGHVGDHFENRNCMGFKPDPKYVPEDYTEETVKKDRASKTAMKKAVEDGADWARLEESHSLMIR